MDTATVSPADGPEPAHEAANRYGRFSPDGSEYWITDPRTPRPWVNVIANPRLGLVVSQTGSGITWIDNSHLAVITRWQQDLLQDCSGKFLYLRDVASGEVWSLSPAPTWPAHELYRCRHGLGSFSLCRLFQLHHERAHQPTNKSRLSACSKPVCEPGQQGIYQRTGCEGKHHKYITCLPLFPNK